MAAYLVWRADSAVKEDRNILAFTLCILAVTLLVEGLKLDMGFFSQTLRILSRS